MGKISVVAVDLGAESGRVIEISFDGERLEQHEIHRFPNLPVRVHQTIYWDVLRLWQDILTGIGMVGSRAASIGIDTWGVDFAFLDRDGNLLANPVHYRDARTDGLMEWVFERVPRRQVFEYTGVQFMALNTLYQLASLARNRSPLLEMAESYLALPDLFNYWLTGARKGEFTHATTTQLYNPRTCNWDWDLLDAIGIPKHIFPELVQPGTQLGDYNGIPVIAPASHDTASAVLSVPTTTDNFAYLSSGTWSLLGLELDHPVISDTAYEVNVTNEGGAYGTFTFLKNVVGLWIAQQCRSTWQAEGTSYSYEQIAQEASNAAPFRNYIDPDDPMFLSPGDMPSRVREFCQRTGQPIPESVGQIMRTVFESLAFKYRVVLDCLIELTGKQVDRLHIVGGGGRNALLCQMAANVTGRQVVVGPFEATAWGNGIVQLISLGVLDNISQAREILSRTQDTIVYEPQHVERWAEEYQRYRQFARCP
ncbi:MAG TPA: rhamnulokinase family protein [Aggregatilineaceae bacterium]|nr:rhamnulokinase family protein [Aggregatilineaceae bacterium]